MSRCRADAWPGLAWTGLARLGDRVPGTRTVPSSTKPLAVRVQASGIKIKHTAGAKVQKLGKASVKR